METGDDDFERALAERLTDPDFREHLRALDERRRRGEMITHTDQSVLERLGLSGAENPGMERGTP